MYVVTHLTLQGALITAQRLKIMKTMRDGFILQLFSTKLEVCEKTFLEEILRAQVYSLDSCSSLIDCQQRKVLAQRAGYVFYELVPNKNYLFKLHLLLIYALEC